MCVTRSNAGIEPLTFDQASKLLEYDPATGVIRWITDRAYAVKYGDIAGYSHPSGYLRIDVNRKGYQAHRIAFLLMTGDWPVDIIDHAYGDKTNNAWANLSNATDVSNMKNKKRRKDCPILTGVCFNKNAGLWAAHISSDRKRTTKYFKCLLSAIACRYRMEKELGFSDSHGRRS